MTVEQLAKELDKIIPPELSEPWDNDGRMVIPDKNAEVTKVLCALECTSVSIAIAKRLGCNVILTHHPLIFKPLNSLSESDCVGKRVLECVKSGISVLSYHTRLDILSGGVNDMLAEMLGIKNTDAFVPYGRVGEVEEQSFESFVNTVKTALEVPESELRLVKANEKVSRVAVISGCGKDEIRDAIVSGADTFVTGEVMHSHMVECKEWGISLICATHYATERFIARKLADIVGKLGLKHDIYEFVKEEEYGI